MRAAVALLAAFAFACGDSSSSLPDAGGGDDSDGSIDPTGDSGTGGVHTVKLTLTNRPMNAQAFSFFVAYQDGSAPWQPAPAPTGDTYALPIHAPSYSVAYGCIGTVTGTTPTQLRTVTLAQFAVGERTELAFDVPARSTDRGGDTVMLTGTVQNRPLGGFSFVQFGDRTAFVGTVSGNFTLQTPPGTHDLVVAHAIPQGNGEFFVDETVVARDVAITGATNRTIDFSAAVPTQSFPVEVDVNSFEVRVVASTTLYTENGTALGTVRESQGWDSIALADAQMRAGDVYDQAIELAVPGRGVTVTNATSTPGAQTFVPVPLLDSPSSTVVTRMPYPIIETTWPAYADSVGYAWNATQQLGYQQCGNQACTVVWTAYLSPGVTGTMPGFRMPALADLPGWKRAFELADNVQAVGSVTAMTSSAGAGDFPPGTPTAGTQRAFVRADFAVTP
jgi:hypothetical protein